MTIQERSIEREAYDSCVSWHALNWLKHYQTLNSTNYLEQNGGVIIAHFINKKGIAQVLMDLDKKIENVLN